MFRFNRHHQNTMYCILNKIMEFFWSYLPNYNVTNVFYLPTDAQEDFIKNIKIYIKNAPTCFGLITIIRELTLHCILWVPDIEHQKRTISPLCTNFGLQQLAKFYTVNTSSFLRFLKSDTLF